MQGKNIEAVRIAFPADDILPALLVTTRHPRTFHEVFGPSARFRAPADALLLIPLRKTCKTPDDVVTWVDRLFRDVAWKKELCDSAVAKEMRRGAGSAIVDAIIQRNSAEGVPLRVRCATSRAAAVSRSRSSIVYRG